MYFCFIYGPFLVLRMFKIICYVDDIIGSDVQGHGLIYARYIKLPLLCSYVSTLYSSMFIGFYGWSCFLTMLCFFFICYRFDAFLTFLWWKMRLTISSWKGMGNKPDFKFFYCCLSSSSDDVADFMVDLRGSWGLCWYIIWFVVKIINRMCMVYCRM